MSKPHKSKNKGTKPTHDAEKPLPKPELSKRDLPFLLRPLKEMPKRPPVVLPPRDLLRCRGVPLNELLTKPLDDLRAIGCFDENVSTKGSEMFIYIELTIAWPGHHEPRIEVSTRVLSDDCVLVAQLAVEIAKKCPRRIEYYANSGTPKQKKLMERVFQMDLLRLASFEYVETQRDGTYHALVESTLLV